MDVNEAKKKMTTAVENLKSELSKLRTGRANPDVIKDVQVSLYESKMPIEHLANISVPDANTINIKPWDENAVEAIEKAILASDVGLTPTVDGNLIRVTVPSLTQELREEYVKDMKELVEQAKVGVRQIRQKIMNEIDDLQNQGGVSEDVLNRKREEIESEVSEVTKEMDEIAEEKKEELMTI